MTAPALACRGLVHVYRVDGTDVAALRGVDLVVAEGQRVALLGPSGSGKSTLFAILGTMMRPSAGDVEVFGVDLRAAGRRALRALRAEALGLMLQGAARNLRLQDDALGNIEFVVRGLRRGDVATGVRVLTEGGVHPLGGPVGRLPPDQQQVVALAVAMAPRPRLLLADEPTSRLDEGARDRLLDLMIDSAEASGSAMLIVTHDVAVARRTQRMIHLRDGRIAEEATASGHYAVIGADVSIPMPSGAEALGWTPGSLVAVEVGRDEIRVRRAGGT